MYMKKYDFNTKNKTKWSIYKLNWLFGATQQTQTISENP